MSDCEFFKIETKTMRSNPMGGSPSKTEFKLPWCAHARSPLPLHNANSMESTKLLTCGGFISKCTIPNR